MGFSIPGADLVKKGFDGAKKLGGKAVDKAADVGGSAVKRAGQVKDTVVEGTKDAVHFSGEVLEKGAQANNWVNEQKLNFGKGVLEWGKGTVGTVVGLATHPVESAKAVGKLATNPVLNPVLGLPVAAIQGKNPVEAYKEGGEQLKGIGEGLYNDYKTQYDKNGVAGLAGYIAPDLAMAVLSGGGSAGAKGGATAAGKAITKEVAEEAVEQGAKQTLKETAKGVGKEAVKELAPDAKTISDGARKEEAHNGQPDQNWLEALVSNFSF